MSRIEGIQLAFNVIVKRYIERTIGLDKYYFFVGAGFGIALGLAILFITNRMFFTTAFFAITSVIFYFLGTQDV